MMLIARIEAQDGPAATLRVEGRVVGPWVDELRREADRVLGASRPLVLDLFSVSYADRRGEELLQELVRRGAEVRERSTYVAELLRGEP